MTDIRGELARAIANAIEDAAKHHGGIDSLWPQYLAEADAVLPIVARAVAAEREACADVAERTKAPFTAHAIRARGPG